MIDSGTKCKFVENEIVIWFRYFRFESKAFSIKHYFSYDYVYGFDCIMECVNECTDNVYNVNGDCPIFYFYYVLLAKILLSEILINKHYII